MEHWVSILHQKSIPAFILILLLVQHGPCGLIGSRASNNLSYEFKASWCEIICGLQIKLACHSLYVAVKTIECLVLVNFALYVSANNVHVHLHK